jgi:hypothetical protein
VNGEDGDSVGVHGERVRRVSSCHD